MGYFHLEPPTPAMNPATHSPQPSSKLTHIITLTLLASFRATEQVPRDPSSPHPSSLSRGPRDLAEWMPLETWLLILQLLVCQG